MGAFVRAAIERAVAQERRWSNASLPCHLTCVIVDMGRGEVVRGPGQDASRRAQRRRADVAAALPISAARVRSSVVGIPPSWSIPSLFRFVASQVRGQRPTAAAHRAESGSAQSMAVSTSSGFSSEQHGSSGRRRSGCGSYPRRSAAAPSCPRRAAPGWCAPRRRAGTPGSGCRCGPSSISQNSTCSAPSVVGSHAAQADHRVVRHRRTRRRSRRARPRRRAGAGPVRAASPSPT